MVISARIFIAVLIILSIIVIYFVIKPDNGSSPNRLATVNVIQSSETVVSEEGIIDALVIDNDSVEGVSLYGVLEGDDIILLYIPKQAQLTSIPEEVFVFNDLASLDRFDKDDSGYIDIQDPIYHLLYVGVLDAEDKTLRYAKLDRVGITVIVLNQNYLESEKAKDIKRFKQLAGAVITADSSRWQLKVIPMNINQFAGLRLIAVE